MNTRYKTLVAVATIFIGALLGGCSESAESMLKSAKGHIGKNERSAAVVQLRAALQKEPDLAEARFLLGKALFETGDLVGAEKELRRASELKYSPDQVVPLIASLEVRRGEYKKAVGEFGTTVLKEPQAKAALLTTLGLAHLALGSKELAADRFATAIIVVPDFPPALIGQARMTAIAEDLPGALALAQRAVAKQPSFSDGWEYEGDLLLVMGKLDEALVAFQKAIETDPYNLAAHFAAVSIQLDRGKVEDAAKQLDEMKKVAPKNPQTMYLQASLAFRQQNYAAARESIQQYLKVAPNSAPGLLLSARVNYQLKAYTQAEAELHRVLLKTPNHWLARRLLVRMYLRTDQPQKALDAIAPILQAGSIDGSTLTLIGEVYAQNGDLKKAGAYFEQASAVDPNNPAKRTTVALAHVAQGDARAYQELEAAAAKDPGIRPDLTLVVANIRQKKFDAALAAVASLEKKQPQGALPDVLRGGVYMTKGDRAAARRSFEQALAKDPASFPAASNLAYMDLADNKPDDARKRFEALLAKDPKSVEALLAIASLRARAREPSEEIAKQIAKAVAAAPSDPAPRLALIAHYTRNREYKLAVATGQEALSALPEQPEVIDALGRAYLAAGDTNQALTTYGKLAQLEPNSPTALIRMAEVQLAADNRTAALESLRKALAVKPDFVDAQRLAIALDLGAGRSGAALTTAREIQKQRPKESVGYLLEGDVYARQKAWTEAISAYRGGLKAVGTTDLAIRLDAALDISGSSAEAESFAASWLKEHPGDLAFRHYWSELALSKKDFSGAANRYKALLAQDPNDLRALNNLAWVAGQLKDPKAIEYAEKAYTLSPSNPAILDTLGTLLVEKGDSARGIEMLQKAVALSPDASAMRLNLARALVKSGQKDVAKKELDVLAKLGDSFADQGEVARLMQGL